MSRKGESGVRRGCGCLKKGVCRRDVLATPCRSGEAEEGSRMTGPMRTADLEFLVGERLSKAVGGKGVYVELKGSPGGMKEKGRACVTHSSKRAKGNALEYLCLCIHWVRRCRWFAHLSELVTEALSLAKYSRSRS